MRRRPRPDRHPPVLPRADRRRAKRCDHPPPLPLLHAHYVGGCADHACNPKKGAVEREWSVICAAGRGKRRAVLRFFVSSLATTSFAFFPSPPSHPLSHTPWAGADPPSTSSASTRPSTGSWPSWAASLYVLFFLVAFSGCGTASHRPRPPLSDPCHGWWWHHRRRTGGRRIEESGRMADAALRPPLSSVQAAAAASLAASRRVSPLSASAPPIRRPVITACAPRVAPGDGGRQQRKANPPPTRRPDPDAHLSPPPPRPSLPLLQAPKASAGPTRRASACRWSSCCATGSSACFLWTRGGEASRESESGGRRPTRAPPPPLPVCRVSGLPASLPRCARARLSSVPRIVADAGVCGPPGTRAPPRGRRGRRGRPRAISPQLCFPARPRPGLAELGAVAHCTREKRRGAGERGRERRRRRGRRGPLERSASHFDAGGSPRGVHQPHTHPHLPPTPPPHHQVRPHRQGGHLHPHAAPRQGGRQGAHRRDLPRWADGRHLHRQDGRSLPPRLRLQGPVRVPPRGAGRRRRTNC